MPSGEGKAGAATMPRFEGSGLPESHGPRAREEERGFGPSRAREPEAMSRAKAIKAVMGQGCPKASTMQSLGELKNPGCGGRSGPPKGHKTELGGAEKPYEDEGAGLAESQNDESEAKDPRGLPEKANDKCPLPKAEWGTFSAGPSPRE